jgi:hypothetical protein
MPHYDKDRLMCVAMFLFQLEEHNRLEQRGILKRFSIDCYGKQHTLEDSRSMKSEKYKELSKQSGTKEYEMWFLKYVPADLKTKRTKKETVMKPAQSKRTYKKRDKTPTNPIAALLRMRGSE